MWIDYAILLVFTLASAALVLWFFRIRRIMLLRQRLIIAALEEVFKPRDKTYYLLGYLVGFRAEYHVERGGVRRLWVLYVMPPHHALLYLPLIKLLGRRERISLTAKVAGTVASEAHVVDTRDTWSKRSFTADYGAERLHYCSRRNDLMVCGATDLVELLIGFRRQLAGHGIRVTRLSVDRWKNVVHVTAIIEGADPYPLLRGFLRLIRSITLK